MSKTKDKQRIRSLVRAAAWSLLLLPLLLFSACGDAQFDFRDDPGRPTTVDDVVENLRLTVQGWVDTLDAAVKEVTANAPGAIENAAEEIESGIAGLVEEAGPVVREVIDGVERGMSELLGGTIPATGDSPDRPARPTLPSDGLSVRVDFVDIGQGAAVLVRSSQGEVALIDGGELGSGLVEFLRDEQVERIDLLIATHPHSDHIGGLVDVLEAIPVERVVTNGQMHTTQVYERFLDAISLSEAEYIEAARGTTLPFGGLTFEVLNPPSTGGVDYGGDLNENSLVLRLDVGQVAFLFTGDTEAGAEANMIQANQPLRAEVLHIAHHGSQSSTTNEFIAAVRPTVAVYQAGAGNTYGHPHARVIRSLQAAQVQVYGTSTYGTISIITDGISYQIITDQEQVPEAQP
jgi:competence protein ComEC